MQPLPMKPGATVALLGDWGTGTAAATQLLQQVAAHNPDVLIHLGDIYYSGTADECVNNFEAIVNRVFNREQNPITVFTLAGNHDMYSGGEGYYGLLKRLNPPPYTQPASFFCLRSTDNKWQFLAMDTGLHDDDPFNVDTVLTFLNPNEEDWHAARIAEFPGKTILLSHHQLFSALAQIGPRNAEGLSEPVNPFLQTSYVRFAKAARQEIAAWFWGHEHAFTIYDDEDYPKGRCLGHGAIPALGDPAPALPQLTYSPRYQQLVLPLDPLKYYTHGFAILKLPANGAGTAAYYHQLAPGVAMFSEPL
jgi:3',5'-cyclic AMP phosphodiesterase CpdA